MTNWVKILKDIIGGFSGDGGAAQDDSIKASLDLAHTDLDTIITDTEKIYDVALGVSPTDGALASFLATGGTALGTRLPASKSLYDVIALDRLDHATYGLSALNTDLGTIITDTEKIYDVALGTAPIDGSLASFLATGGTALGTRLPASKSLYDVIALDRLAGGEYTGTVSAGTAAKTLIKEITTTKRTEIKGIWLDLTLLVTAGATIELEHKIDGSTYRVFETDSWALADDDGVFITGFTINNDFKISITGGEAAGVNIPYNIIYQNMES